MSMSRVFHVAAANKHWCRQCLPISTFETCRDLKPENLLIGHDGELRLSDFGWAVHMKGDQPRMTMCGTTDYLAPEMVGKRPHDTTVDLWCIGVLCYELLYGFAPFEAQNNMETRSRIERLDLRFGPLRGGGEVRCSILTQVTRIVCPARTHRCLMNLTTDL